MLISTDLPLLLMAVDQDTLIGHQVDLGRSVTPLPWTYKLVRPQIDAYESLGGRYGRKRPAGLPLAFARARWERVEPRECWGAAMARGTSVNAIGGSLDTTAKLSAVFGRLSND